MQVAKVSLSTPIHKIRHKNFSTEVVREIENSFECDSSFKQFKVPKTRESKLEDKRPRNKRHVEF